MTRTAPALLTLLLCSAALCACASLGATDKPAVKADASPSIKPVMTGASDIDGNVRQAQLLRVAGQYDQAVRILSQLMLVAADDPRVVGEYGKTLAAQGRSKEASDFLKRAVELSPSDWTVYSALGVSYDQLGDQNSARTAYEHALALNPGDASILNNYALSRMLAHDTSGAQTLISRAESAGGANDTQIARNIALIHSLQPAAMTPAVAAGTPAEARPMARNDKTGAPDNHAQREATAAARALISSQPMPVDAPRPLQPQNPNQTAFLPAPPQATAPTVVMQRVPEDPLAGPVKPHNARVAAKTPTHASAVANARPDAKDALAAAAAKAQAAADAMSEKPAMKAEARPAVPKAEPVKAAKAEPMKAEPAKAAKAEPKNEPARTAVAKADTPKAGTPKADAKAAPVKTADAPRKDGKDAVPALRLAAEKY